MKIIKEDKEKNITIVEDTLTGYRYRLTLDKNRMRQIEPCEDYNRKIDLSDRGVTYK